MEGGFAYILRFCSDPLFRPKRDIAAVASFAQQADIDDVMLFVAPQDLNNGHVTVGEQQIYIEHFENMQKVLAGIGVGVSVNPWVSFVHEDLGQKMAQEHNFEMMADINGEKSNICVCPAGPVWQEYFVDMYARFASFAPSAVWVEDDFRFHHHPPLAWGGCFCQRHMDMYSQKAGKTISRAEFVAGIVQQGKPHPYRKIWLETCAEVQEQLADKIGSGVRAVSPKTKVGLMSSTPQAHAAEGRRWAALLKNLAHGGPVVSRTHLPGYVEVSAKEYIKNFNMVSMLSRHFVPAEAEIYPEGENYPYSLFTKSLAFTRYQMLSSLPLNEKGITLNIFDLNGNGIVMQENFQQMLRKAKPFLSKATNTGVFAWPAGGVKVMCAETSAYTMQTQIGEGINELQPHEAFWGGYLPLLGIPYSYCSDFDIKRSVVAVSGQFLRNMSHPQLVSLFENNKVILNGDAADALVQMSCGGLAKMKKVRWMRHNSGEYTFEQMRKANEAYSEARASSVIFGSDILSVEYTRQVEEYSCICNAQRKRVAHGVVQSANTVVFPFGNFDSPLEIPPMLLGRSRQLLLQHIVQGMRCGEIQGFPVVLDSPNAVPYYYVKGDERALFVVNACSDKVKKLVVNLPKSAEDVTLICSENDNEIFIGTLNAGNNIIDCKLLAMECILLRWREQT